MSLDVIHELSSCLLRVLNRRLQSILCLVDIFETLLGVLKALQCIGIIKLPNHPILSNQSIQLMPHLVRLITQQAYPNTRDGCRTTCCSITRSVWTLRRRSSLRWVSNVAFLGCKDAISSSNSVTCASIDAFLCSSSDAYGKQFLRSRRSCFEFGANVFSMEFFVGDVGAILLHFVLDFQMFLGKRHEGAAQILLLLLQLIFL